MIKAPLLLKKLTSYSTLAVVVLASKKNADAQTLLTQVDTTICEYGSYSLDLNNDGIIDFIINTHTSIRISYYGFGSELRGEVFVSNRDSNAIAEYKNYIASLFNSGQEIGAKDSFNTHTGFLIDKLVGYFEGHRSGYYYYFGLWDTTKHDKFLGLQLKVNSNTYYGWARLSVTADARYYCFELKDYAINTNPNESILTREEIRPPTNNGSLVLFPDPISSKSDLSISFQLSSSLPSTITIYNIAGELIKTITIQNTYSGINTLPINVTGLSEGMYILKLTTSQFESVAKFVISQ